jgi:hypothetical protein
MSEISAQIIYGYRDPNSGAFISESLRALFLMEGDDLVWSSHGITIQSTRESIIDDALLLVASSFPDILSDFVALREFSGKLLKRKKIVMKYIEDDVRFRLYSDIRAVSEKLPDIILSIIDTGSAVRKQKSDILKYKNNINIIDFDSQFPPLRLSEGVNSSDFSGFFMRILNFTRSQVEANFLQFKVAQIIQVLWPETYAKATINDPRSDAVLLDQSPISDNCKFPKFLLDNLACGTPMPQVEEYIDEVDKPRFVADCFSALMIAERHLLYLRQK